MLTLDAIHSNIKRCSSDVDVTAYDASHRKVEFLLLSENFREREREKCALKRNTIAQRRGDSGASGAKDIKQQNETPLLLTLSYN